MPESLPHCPDCIHYYITHDAHFRYGCRAMNFKSPRPPGQAVFKAAGVPCLSFQPKPPKAGKR
jgi:hypothetical protein